MVKVNLYNAAGEVIEEYTDVIAFDSSFVEYKHGGYRAKTYCDTFAGEYFAEVPPEADGEEATEADYINALGELGVQLNEES